MRPWRFLFPELRGGLVLYIKDVSSTISMSRPLPDFPLGLELTGVYTLFWSIANVVHSLAVYSVLQSQLPHLIASGKSLTGRSSVRSNAACKSKSAPGRCCRACPRHRHAIAVPFLGRPWCRKICRFSGSCSLRPCCALPPMLWVCAACVQSGSRDRGHCRCRSAGVGRNECRPDPPGRALGGRYGLRHHLGGLFAARYFFSRPGTFAIGEGTAKS